MPKDAAGRRWTRGESEAAFAELGDGVIDVWRRVNRSERRRRLERELYSVGEVQLSPVQIDALEALVSKAEWRMNEIAAELHVDPSTATRTFEPLLELGLAERRTDDADRRYTLISATEAGRRQSEHVSKARRQLMKAVMRCMAPERRLLFVELLEEWIDAQEAEAAQREQRTDLPESRR